MADLPKTDRAICMEYLKSMHDRMPQAAKTAIQVVMLYMALEPLDASPQWFTQATEREASRLYLKRQGY